MASLCRQAVVAAVVVADVANQTVGNRESDLPRISLYLHDQFISEDCHVEDRNICILILRSSSLSISLPTAAAA
jgi:hypothetical protein